MARYDKESSGCAREMYANPLLWKNGLNELLGTFGERVLPTKERLATLQLRSSFFNSLPETPQCFKFPLKYGERA